jgi:hypothetical protein
MSDYVALIYSTVNGLRIGKDAEDNGLEDGFGRRRKVTAFK